MRGEIGRVRRHDRTEVVSVGSDGLDRCRLLLRVAGVVTVEQRRNVVMQVAGPDSVRVVEPQRGLQVRVLPDLVEDRVHALVEADAVASGADQMRQVLKLSRHGRQHADVVRRRNERRPVRDDVSGGGDDSLKVARHRVDVGRELTAILVLDA